MASEMTTPHISKPESRAATLIREIFESGRPLTYVRSAEEQRIARVLAEVAANLLASGPVPVWTWSLTEGMRRGDEPVEPGTETPRGVLDHIIAHNSACHFPPQGFP